MRILIIGGTRFIGPPVVRRLHAMGHTLRLFHRTPSPVTFPPDVMHLLGDKREALEDFSETFRQFGPDVVLETAPLVEEDGHRLMKTFKGIAGRVVILSSQDVYRAYGRVNNTEPGPPDPVPLTEEAPLREKWYPYRGETARAKDDPTRWLDDYDKIPVERAVMGDPDLPGTVLRLPMIYGPGDTQHRLFPYLKRMDDGRPAILMSEQTARWRWTRAYVENAAAAIALAVTETRAAGRIYNVGEMPALSMAQWVREIGLAAGWSGKIVIASDYQLPTEMKARAGMDQNLAADTSRIRADLGYTEPVPREEALRRTVTWERAHPPENSDPAQFDYDAEDAVLATLSK